MYNIFNDSQLRLALLVCSLAYSSANLAENENNLLAKGYESLARGDYVQSFEIFTQLAKQNSAEANFVSALFYKHGWGDIDKDPAKSCEFFASAAEKGIPVAQQEYGFCVMQNHAVGLNEQPGDWFKLAYESGVYEAACDLGRLYLGTVWQERNLPLAVQWCQKAAERSAVNAQVTLGDIYISHSEVFDLERVEFWYTQAINNGSGEAAYKLASLYLKVVGVKSGAENANNKALYLMELASSRHIEKAYEPTAKMYWSKLHNSGKSSSEKVRSELLAKSYVWAKAAHQVNSTDDAARFLGEIEKELPAQWKEELDFQVQEFYENRRP
ncbi:tetratricopeptide repeat protein [Vibrio sp. EA2]|uniref:tetratricopeptide repeat protein n=1 Tax=Vibrio sp. EA2 TaxID=3079860 RepID=UPI0029497E96|nr:tetratricopeptide repeat protein [Vibrio sp. EA2]MDV6250357.1 tetratricopeptide repeat protein [Vibrio sp. EA2]